MTTHPPSVSNDEEYLGVLAMRFRGTRDCSKRQDIAQEYKKTVKRLTKCGKWNEMPPPEDQLPDDCMPKEFFVFWQSVP